MRILLMVLMIMLNIFPGYALSKSCTCQNKNATNTIEFFTATEKECTDLAVGDSNPKAALELQKPLTDNIKCTFEKATITKDCSIIFAKIHPYACYPGD